MYQKIKLYIKPEDITTVKEQIKSTWDKIQAHDFYTGCGKEDCHWCNFVKTNNMAKTLTEVNGEDLLTLFPPCAKITYRSKGSNKKDSL